MKGRQHLSKARTSGFRWRFIGRLLDEAVREGAREEYEERFEWIKARRGRIAAWLWYGFQIFYRMTVFTRQTALWSIIMLRNNLKIAFRHIRRSKGYSSINIFGLAAGMACCILILLWVQDELSFDRSFDNAERLFRVVQERRFSDRTEFTATTPALLASTLKEEYPDIVSTTRFFNTMWSIQHGDQIFSEMGCFADPDFPAMFSLQFTRGDPAGALDDPASIVLTEKTAAKLFGGVDPLGQTLKIDNSVDCRVSAVVREPPRNSHLEFDYIIPCAILKLRGVKIDTWTQNAFISTYAMVPARSEQAAIEQKIAGHIRKYQPDMDSRVFLQPITRIHLHRLEGGGPILYIYIFSSIAAFILLIACINFMNLSTARSRIRAKEVGLRKVVGGRRQDIIRQFFGESQLLTFSALLLAVLMVGLLLPVFNQLSGKEMTPGTLAHTKILMVMAGIAALTGLIAGSYPALYLSSFRPVQTLRGTFSAGGKPSFRKALVIIQFSLSILLMTCTIAIGHQLNYIQSKPLGYSQDFVFSARMSKGSAEFPPIKLELLPHPGIRSITAVDRPPSYSGPSISDVGWEGKPPGEKVNMELRFVDFDFFETLQMEIVQGRTFSREFPTDVQSGLIVNQTAARIMGLETPVGERVRVNERDHTITGVVKDFHIHSLYSEIRPLLIVLRPEECLYILVRIAPDLMSESLALLESKWQRIDPGYNFEYEFLDDRIDRRYRSERRMGRILSTFTALAVLISCLGLLGLAAYMGERRTKEIGIRKVLGSSTSAIVVLLSKEFVRWVLAANLLAWPAAYLLMRNWLRNFAYRAELAWWIFGLAGGAALGIALLTVSFQAVKTAVTDPIDALRYE